VARLARAVAGRLALSLEIPPMLPIVSELSDPPIVSNDGAGTPSTSFITLVFRFLYCKLGQVEQNRLGRYATTRQTLTPTRLRKSGFGILACVLTFSQARDGGKRFSPKC